MKIKDLNGKTITVPKEHEEAVRQMIANNDHDYLTEFASGGWISKAVNPKHKGYCTPLSNPKCTPRRKALAKTFKKHHGFHKQNGGYLPIYENAEMFEDPEFRIGDEGFYEANQNNSFIGSNGKIDQMLNQNTALKQMPSGYDNNFAQSSQFTPPFRQEDNLSYTYGNKTNPWQDLGQQLTPSLNNLQDIPKASIPNLTNSKWWAKADQKFQKGQELAVKAGKAVVDGFTGGMGGGNMGGMSKMFSKANGGKISNNSNIVHAPEMGGYFRKKKK